MDKEAKFFKFLERKKEAIYKTQNNYPSNKTAIGKIELLKEIYEDLGFNFLKVAFLREREQKYYKSLMRAFKNKEETTGLIVESLKHHYRRLRSYDILKVGNIVYVFPEK